jgi:hypothetical protein
VNDGTVTSDGWTVRQEHGFWVAYHPEQGYLHDLTNADYPARYNTRDEVIAHLYGPAAQPV